MIFEHIEKLKKQYTDKYVVVDESQPELQRFRGLTGAVKTVNMSGRALVEFDGYANIGWYDIDPAFLRVVPAPPPKPVEAKKEKAAPPKAESSAAAAKPTAEKKTPAAAAKPAAAPVAGKSVADILAAARKPASAAGATGESKPAAAAPAKVAPGGKGMSMEEILAAARGKKSAGAAPAAKAEATESKATPAAPKPSAVQAAASAASAPAKVAPGGKGMSMEDILAMARGKKPAGGAPAAAPVAEAPAEEASAVEEPVAEESVAEPPAPSAAAGEGSKSLKDKITSVAEQLAYCRKTDAKQLRCHLWRGDNAKRAAMSVPNQHGPQPSKGDGRAVVVAVLLAIGLMAGMCCAGICGGLAFFYSRVDVARIVQPKRQQDDAQATTPPDVMDWIVRSQLSRAYTQALDTVTANKDVIAALGDAVDTTNDPNMLFRRANSGNLQPEETIEFDIQGHRGGAVVSAVCAQMQIPPSAMPGMAGGYEPKKITVTLNDGTQINVPPLTIETPPGAR